MQEYEGPANGVGKTEQATHQTPGRGSRTKTIRSLYLKEKSGEGARQKKADKFSEKGITRRKKKKPSTRKDNPWGKKARKEPRMKGGKASKGK